MTIAGVTQFSNINVHRLCTPSILGSRCPLMVSAISLGHPIPESASLRCPAQIMRYSIRYRCTQPYLVRTALTVLLVIVDGAELSSAVPTPCYCTLMVRFVFVRRWCCLRLSLITPEWLAVLDRVVRKCSAVAVLT